ncbi:3-oxoacyl-ACP reductase FabG [Streptomyces sp. BE308]|uniref:SDR family NAD(P)-dependent oxidoreductase n=1 Tax=unclassified Streptomyces TaxID=2593676 RepID=UPI002DDABCCF|nr:MULTISPECIES: 3-oxoacyl-ACP reductase family protein [unclassified Streptomyces]MEE1792783.1 3-oxoacyl-ACP reductase FabG [Streptomyces sp. BE308]WRZ70336.1 3-oxoacyl-ACP reductase FabG [Streptomyces sp. NBC_01237]
MSEKLNGKVALVTGASRGIGAAVALRLAEDGADVAITYQNNEDAARATVERIEKKTGRRVLAVRADVADADSVAASVEQAVRELGRLDIVINNAGVNDMTLPNLADMPVETVDWILDVNTRGAILTARAAAKHLPEGGRVVNIGSCLGEHVPAAGYAVYAASKAALTGFTKGLAWDLGPRGITVNEVAPGSTNTDMNPEDGPASAYQKALSPLNRFAQPEEVAAAVAYFASPEAAFTTGTRVGVDGGVNA